MFLSLLNYTPLNHSVISISFQKKGYDKLRVTGTDISLKMLKVAKERNCYDTLLKLDLSKPLPYLDDSFDYLMCVGSTTYLGKQHERLLNIIWIKWYASFIKNQFREINFQFRSIRPV